MVKTPSKLEKFLHLLLVVLTLNSTPMPKRSLPGFSALGTNIVFPCTIGGKCNSRVSNHLIMVLNAQEETRVEVRVVKKKRIGITNYLTNIKPDLSLSSAQNIR